MAQPEENGKARITLFCRPVVPGGAGGDPQILADQLTLSQPGGGDYAHYITTGTPGFSDLPTALVLITYQHDKDGNAK